MNHFGNDGRWMKTTRSGPVCDVCGGEMDCDMWGNFCLACGKRNGPWHFVDEEIEVFIRPKRVAVFERDGGNCHYCGAKLNLLSFHMDHKTPRAAGGTSRIENLVASCERCNLSKHTKSYESFKAQLSSGEEGNLEGRGESKQT